MGWIGIARGKFYSWRNRYGKVTEQNALVPRDHWLTEEERRKIVAFHEQYPLEGYRRLTYMMIDKNVVAASSSSVYRSSLDLSSTTTTSGYTARSATSLLRISWPDARKKSRLGETQD